MKENDEFIIENNDEYDDDARAVKESELLPIYEAMYFSGDIQPVEDVEIPGYEKKTRLEERADSKNSEIKKKTNPIFSALNIKQKRIIAVVLALIVVVGAITGAIAGIVGGSENELPVKSVFTANSKMLMILSDGKSYELSGAQEAKVSDNAMMVYYSKKTSSKTGKFDLRAVDVSKRSSLKKSGALVDNGVDEGWQINSDGSFLCYIKTESGVRNLYLYSAQAGKTQLVSSDVEEVFLPSKGDVVYFTRRAGSVYSLHRLRYGEEAHNVASGIDYVNFCDSYDGFEILYTVQTGNKTNVDVFLVTDFREPVKICSDVNEVYADDYSYKGNLYFFIKNNATVDWQDFIKDSYYESDATLQRPVEGDFMVEKGFIFKRYVLDTVAYNAAKRKYEAKLHRDNIRSELDKIDLGLAVRDDYTCYVYNGLTTKKLASGVMLENVVDYSVTGAPALIYRKSVIAVENKITMDKLTDISSDGNITDAIDYVREAVGGSYKLSDDCIYARYDGTKVLGYTVDGYDAARTDFILASGSLMYALTDGELWYNEISDSGITKGTLVDTNVNGYSYENGFLYYEKAVTPDRISLYRHSVRDSKQYICDDLYSYFPVDSNYILLLTRQESDSELMDIGIFTDGRYTVVDTDVSLKNFVYNGRNFAYIKNVGSSGIPDEGEIYVYTPDSGVKKISDGVTEIAYVN